jgi:hypothetical protein
MTFNPVQVKGNSGDLFDLSIKHHLLFSKSRDFSLRKYKRSARYKKQWNSDPLFFITSIHYYRQYRCLQCCVNKMFIFNQKLKVNDAIQFKSRNF